MERRQIEFFNNEQSSKCIIIDWDSGNARDLSGSYRWADLRDWSSLPPLLRRKHSIDCAGQFCFWSFGKAKVFRFPFLSFPLVALPPFLWQTQAGLPASPALCDLLTHLASTSVQADSAISKEIGPLPWQLPQQRVFVIVFLVVLSDFDDHGRASPVAERARGNMGGGGAFRMEDGSARPTSHHTQEKGGEEDTRRLGAMKKSPAVLFLSLLPDLFVWWTAEPKNKERRERNY